MRVYRGAWLVVVTALGAVALLATPLTVGVIPVVVTAAVLAACGAAFGQGLDDVKARRQASTRFAVRCGVAGVLCASLGGLLGPWALVVIPFVGLLHPGLVATVLGRVRCLRPVSRPDRLSDMDLACRWRRTTDEIRRPSTPTDQILRLDEERQLLLDEIERRDPIAFSAQLARQGWREPQDS
jgi:hypothetical protein